MIEEAIDGAWQDAVHAEARRQESEASTRMDGLDPADAEVTRNAGRRRDAAPEVVSAIAGRDMEPHSTEGSR